MVEGQDDKYLDLLVSAVRVSADYRPQFGKRRAGGFGLQDFQDLYGADQFYRWFGLNEPMLYAAHRAAGGMTSIYRQIGIGCERLFREILRDSLGLSDNDVRWSYETVGPSGRAQTLHLDGRIPFDSITSNESKRRLIRWVRRTAQSLDVDSQTTNSLKGAVFEVRQGYKSKDSKRQVADVANAAVAYTKSYLPCVLVLSNQIDDDIVRRYRNARWAILTGTIGQDDSINSTYDFMEQVVGYDLAGFFTRNSATIREEVQQVVHALLEETA